MILASSDEGKNFLPITNALRDIQRLCCGGSGDYPRGRYKGLWRDLQPHVPPVPDPSDLKRSLDPHPCRQMCYLHQSFPALYRTAGFHCITQRSCKTTVISVILRLLLISLRSAPYRYLDLIDHMLRMIQRELGENLTDIVTGGIISCLVISSYNLFAYSASKDVLSEATERYILCGSVRILPVSGYKSSTNINAVCDVYVPSIKCSLSMIVPTLIK